MDKRERQFWNVVKGIAVFLMVWGHCLQYCAMDSFDFFEDAAFATIYTFHMPAFMLVSGYLFFYSFQKRELGTLLQHRIQSMLHPIIFATILHNVLMLIPEWFLTDRIRVFKGALFTGFDYVYWFLWAVLLSGIAVGVAWKVSCSLSLQLLLTAAGAVFLMLFPMWEMCLFMYPFFVIGFLCGKYRTRAVQGFPVLKYGFFILFLGMLPFYEKKHYIYLTATYLENAGSLEILSVWSFRFVIGLAGSITLLAVTDLLIRVMHDKRIGARILSAVEAMGENSLQMYCLSVPLLSGYLPHLYRKGMELFGGNIFAKSMLVYDLLFTPALSVLACAAIYLAVWVLRKCGLHKLIFGR